MNTSLRSLMLLTAILALQAPHANSQSQDQTFRPPLADIAFGIQATSAAAFKSDVVLGYVLTNSAFVFHYRPNEDGWSCSSKLMPGNVRPRTFGSVVAMSDAGIAVGGDSESRVVLMFESKPGDQTPIDRLTLDDATTQSGYAVKLAMHGNRLLAVTKSRLHLFQKTDTHWTLESTIDIPSSMIPVQSIALQDDRLAVGWQNHATVYELINGSWQSKLTIDAPAQVVAFGGAVALSSSQILVSAANGVRSYNLDGSLSQTIASAATGLGNTALALAANDQRMVIHDYSQPVTTLLVYVWDGKQWVKQRQSEQTKAYDRNFGALRPLRSISIGDEVAVGLSSSTSHVVGASVKKIDGWTPPQSIVPTRILPGFSSSSAQTPELLAIVEDKATAPSDAYMGDISTGAVDIYARSAAGLWTWERQINLFNESDRQQGALQVQIPAEWSPLDVATEAAANATSRVSLSGEWLAASSGAKVFLHRRDGGAWTRTQTIDIPRPAGGVSITLNGKQVTTAHAPAPKVALSGRTLVVSLRYEKVRIYHLNDSNVWEKEQETDANDTCSIATNGTVILLAAAASPSSVDPAPKGIVRVLRKSGAKWTGAGTLPRPSPATNDGYAQDVAIDGSNVIVTGRDKTAFYADSGSTWVSRGVFNHKIPPTDPGEGPAEPYFTASINGTFAGKQMPLWSPIFSLFNTSSNSPPIPPCLFKQSADGQWQNAGPNFSIFPPLITVSNVSDGIRPWFTARSSTSVFTVRNVQPKLTVFADRAAPSFQIAPNDYLVVGSLRPGQSITRHIIVRNDGLVPCNDIQTELGRTINTDVSIINPPAKSLPPGATTSFDIRITGITEGDQPPTVWLRDNGIGQVLFAFHIQGGVSKESPAPEAQINSPLFIHYLASNPNYGIDFLTNIKGSAPVEMQWYRNGSALPGETSNQLRLPKPRLTDGGSYQIKVSGDNTSAISSPSHLVVIDTSDKQATVLEGKPVTLSATIQGPKEMKLWWAREDNTFTGPLTDGERYSGTTSPQLTIKRSTLDDGVPHFLYMQIGDTETLIMTVTLQVTPTPKITTTQLGPWKTLIPVEEPLQTNMPIFGIYADGLPPGLKLNTQTGLISGTPRQAGTYKVRLRAITNDRGSSEVVTIPVVVNATDFGGAGSFHGLIIDGDFSYPIDLNITASGMGTASWTSPTATTTGLISLEASNNGDVFASLSFRNATGAAIIQRLNFNAQRNSLIAPILPFGAELNIAASRRLTDASLITQQQGRYSAAFIPTGFEGDVSTPRGSGYATVVADSTGNTTWAGRTADGMAFTLSQPFIMGDYGFMRLHIWGPNRQRAISGWLPTLFMNAPIVQSIQWCSHRLPEDTRVADAPYAAGFDPQQLDITICRYIAPARGHALFEPRYDEEEVFGSFEVNYPAAPALSQLLPQSVHFPPNQTIKPVQDAGQFPLFLSVDPRTGIFSGRFSFTDPSPFGRATLVGDIGGILQPDFLRGTGFVLLRLPHSVTESPTSAARPWFSGGIQINVP